MSLFLLPLVLGCLCFDGGECDCFVVLLMPLLETFPIPRFPTAWVEGQTTNGLSFANTPSAQLKPQLEIRAVRSARNLNRPGHWSDDGWTYENLTARSYENR